MLTGVFKLDQSTIEKLPAASGRAWQIFDFPCRVKIMRSYLGPRQNNNCQHKEKTDKEMKSNQETEDDIPAPILGELGPPPGPDIDLSGNVKL